MDASVRWRDDAHMPCARPHRPRTRDRRALQCRALAYHEMRWQPRKPGEPDDARPRREHGETRRGARGEAFERARKTAVIASGDSARRTRSPCCESAETYLCSQARQFAAALLAFGMLGYRASAEREAEVLVGVRRKRGLKMGQSYTTSTTSPMAVAFPVIPSAGHDKRVQGCCRSAKLHARFRHLLQALELRAQRPFDSSPPPNPWRMTAY